MVRFMQSLDICWPFPLHSVEEKALEWLWDAWLFLRLKWDTGMSEVGKDCHEEGKYYNSQGWCQAWNKNFPGPFWLEEGCGLFWIWGWLSRVCGDGTRSIRARVLTLLNSQDSRSVQFYGKHFRSRIWWQHGALLNLYWQHGPEWYVISDDCVAWVGSK